MHRRGALGIPNPSKATRVQTPIQIMNGPSSPVDLVPNPDLVLSTQGLAGVLVRGKVAATGHVGLPVVNNNSLTCLNGAVNDCVA